MADCGEQMGGSPKAPNSIWQGKTSLLGDPESNRGCPGPLTSRVRGVAQRRQLNISDQENHRRRILATCSEEFSTRRESDSVNIAIGENQLTLVEVSLVQRHLPKPDLHLVPRVLCATRPFVSSVPPPASMIPNGRRRSCARHYNAAIQQCR